MICYLFIFPLFLYLNLTDAWPVILVQTVEACGARYFHLCSERLYGVYNFLFDWFGYYFLVLISYNK